MARTFWKGVKGLLGLKESPAAKPRPEKDARAFYTGDEVDSLSLDSMLTEQKGRYGGMVHIVSLAAFHEGVGEKWSRLAPKVTLIAEGIIQRHIGTGNLFRSYLGDTFFLVFRTVDNDEGRRRTQAIADELGTRLVGAAFSGAEEARVGIGEADAASLLEDGGRINAAALLAVVKPSEMPVEKPAPVSVDADGKPRAEPAWTEDEWTGTDRDPRLVEDAAQAGARTEDKAWIPQEHDQPDRPELRMVKIERPKASVGPQWVPLSKPKPDAAEPGSAEPGDHRFAVVYRPTWNAINQAVDVHHCLPSLGDDKMTRIGEDVFAASGGAAGIARLDGLVLRDALRALTTMNRAGAKGTLVVPVHYGSLGRPMWPVLLPLFLDCLEAIRLLGLAMELVAIPPRASAEEITGRIELVRPYCRDVVIRIGLGAPQLDAVFKLMPDAIAVSMSDVPAVARTEAALAPALAELKRAAGDLPVCLWGAQRRQEALLALDAGFSWINGSALMADLPEPKKPLPVPTALFRKITTPAPARQAPAK